jgi:replicative DNA helicase
MSNLAVLPGLGIVPSDDSCALIACLEAEEALLGSMLCDRNAFFRVSTILEPEHFYSTIHQQVFQAIRSIALSGADPSDATAVAFAMSDLGFCSGNDALKVLVRLIEPIVSSVNVEFYSDVIIDRYQKRQIRLLGLRCSELAKSAMPSTDILADLMGQMIEVSSLKVNRTMSLREAAEALGEHTMKVNSGELIPRIIPSGIPGWDNLIDGGFEPGQMIIFGADSGTGKTAAMLQSATAMGRAGYKVSIISMEMSAHQLARREAAAMSGVGTVDQKKGMLSDTQLASIMASIVEMQSEAGDNVRMRHGAIDVDSLILHLRSEIAQYGTEVVWIDNLHSMPGSNDASSLTVIAQKLRDFAQETGLVMINLSQLNSETVSSTNKRPTAASLKWAKALKEVADIVMLGYRDELHNPDSPDKGLIEWICGKYRDGQGGRSIKALYEQALTRFKEYVPYSSGDW